MGKAAVGEADLADGGACSRFIQAQTFLT